MGVHGSRVAKGLSKVSLDLVHGREVELLEQLRAHLDAGRGAELLEGIHALGLGVIVAVHAVVLLVELLGVLGGGHCGDGIQSDGPLVGEKGEERKGEASRIDFLLDGDGYLDVAREEEERS